MSMTSSRPTVRAAPLLWIVAAVLGVIVLAAILPRASFYIDNPEQRATWIVGP